MRRSQVAVEKREQGVNLVPDLRITAQLIDGRQRKQHECVIIGIARRFHDRSVRIEQMYKARPAIRAFGFRQKIIQTLDCDFAALWIPAHLSGFGETIDLPRLNTDTNPSLP
jgi:hypothetical protein